MVRQKIQKQKLKKDDKVLLAGFNTECRKVAGHFVVDMKGENLHK